MTINLKAPELRELKPRIMVCGVGGAGGNAVNNMIVSGLLGVDFIVANTDAQALTSSRAERIIQMGLQVTEGLGAGSQPEVGRAAADEAIEEIRDHLAGAHMVFVTAGMGGGTGTGAAPVIAATARDMGILTVGVVTKPFQFEGARRMRIADSGITELQKAVDTLIVIPNQNLFRVANEKTTFADAFAMADQVLYSGVACITDLMVKEGLINLDFADVRAVMREMGKAMMGTGEASGDRRALQAAEAAIANPLLDEVSMKGARGLLISITGGNDLTLYEVDEAASRIRQEVDEDANIILGATYDQSLDGIVRVSVVATGIDKPASARDYAFEEAKIAEAAQRLRAAVHASNAAHASAPRMQEAIAPPALPPTFASPQPEHLAYAYAQNPPQAAPMPAPPQPPSLQQAQPQQPVFHPHDEVRIQSVAPRAAIYSEASFDPPLPAPERQSIQAGPFIPPQAEAPLRPVRLPTIDDLPLPAQAQLRAQRGDAAGEPQTPEVKRRTLLEKLASFGLSRHDEHQQAAPRPAAQNRALPPAAQPQPQHQPQQQSAPPSQHADYARRPANVRPARAQGNLDPHGRAQAASRIEDDQLEIPAFLRRTS